jgi:S-adenosylmethionine hydrolase
VLPARPLITLLTDFGERDCFVASMKGVILSINPVATIVDLSHQIAPHQIHEAGYFLKSCFRYFPEGTIHVAVVDPGVGTARRPALVSTTRGFFIGPDNGLFSEIYEEEAAAEVRRIDNRQYRLNTAGSTFDGRDVFAPAAAWLSRGVPKEMFGPVIHDPVRRFLVGLAWQDESLIGRIVSVDRFGNLISNLRREDVDAAKFRAQQSAVLIHVGACTIEGMVANYSEGSPDEPRALFNSDGYLEVFLREGSAAERLNCRTGEQVMLTARQIGT